MLAGMMMLGSIVNPTETTAQEKKPNSGKWRVGVTAGADYNVHSMDLQYMNDYQLAGRWGLTMGVSGQYDINDWLGVRADLNLTQKNYRQYRVVMGKIDHRYRNNYVLLPVMASMSFGGQKLRGFCNLGVYGGYWLNSYRWGYEYNTMTDRNHEFGETMEMDSQRDQRWDCGLIGGVGLEYKLAKNWAVQAEVRYYYSTTSTRKQYMRTKDYRYNSTTAIQIGAYYRFGK